MPIETPQGNLDIKNATLRTSNLETQNIKIGSIFVGTGNSLEETANVGNSMSNTIQFTNTHTAFTTTGNVEVGGELTVSGNVSDLNVVSNVNLLHTSNTAALKLNSNVVTEFPRSKKLIKYPRVALTSAAQTESGYEGYFVSQDSATLNGVSNRQAWALFDTQGPGQGTGLASPHFDGSGARFDSSGNYTGGDSLGGISGDWVYIRLPDKIQLQSVALWARFGGLRNPIDATVLGSLNGTNWSVVGSWTGASFTSGKSTSFNLNSTQYYDYIGFVFEKIEAGSSGGYVNFHEIELFGTPEYDPEAHGVDVVVKSVPNVPNTDFLDVFVDAGNASGFTLSGSDVTGVTDLSTPANTMTVNGNVTYNSANKAFVFPGTTSSYMRATLVDGNGNYPLTLSVWFMMTDYNANSWRSIITVGTNGTGEQASIAYDPNQDQLYFGTYGADIYVPHTPELGKWNHVAATFTGGSTTSSTMNVYINGVNMGGVPNGTQTPSFTNNQFVIGGAMNSNGTTVNNPFKGQIANARFYRRAYTSDEIYQLYAYQKEYFGHGDLSMTLKAGRLGIGTSEPRAALDVRGDVAGPFHTFLTGDITTTSSSPTSSAHSPLVSYTFDVPKEYNSYGNANLEVFGQVKWSGECPDPWNTNLSLRLYYGSGLTSYIGSAQVSGGSNSKGCGMIAVSHHSDNGSTLDSAIASSKFLIPNCPVSPGSQLKLEILHSQGANSGTVYTNRTTGATTTDYNYERGTTNFFMALKVV